MERHHDACYIVPPYLLANIVNRGEASLECRNAASYTIFQSPRFDHDTTEDVSGPDASGTQMAKGPPTGIAVQYGLVRRVYTMDGGTDFPQHLLRADGQNAVSPGYDESADQCYQGFASTYNFYKEVLGRTSVDDLGMTLVGFIHYGQMYNNAMWDGQRMVFGDGDGVIFRGFTDGIDVIGHALTHAVISKTANLHYDSEPGALRESICDVFASMIKQYQLQQTSETADWLIGQSVFNSTVNAVALRSLKAPGTAYNDPQLGRDPQPSHYADYVDIGSDSNGAYINSSIPNRAFYLVAMALGGHSWETAGKIWYRTLTGGRLSRAARFKDFATLTAFYAANMNSPRVKDAVVEAWAAVGITIPDPVIQNDIESAIDEVAQYILDRPNLNGSQMWLTAEWGIPQFLEENFLPNTTLADVPTVSGSALNARASTCREYMCERWESDNLGFQLLKYVDEAIKDLRLKKTEWTQVEGHIGRSSILSMEASRAQVKISVSDDRVFAYVAQALAWLCAAVRETDSEELAISDVRIFFDSTFHIWGQPLVKIKTEEEASCWHRLFKHTVIANTHFVPREGGTGLEIPFEVMAGRAAVEHEVSIDGGSILMGFSTLLIPVKRLSNGIQWHLEVWDLKDGHIPLSALAKLGDKWLKAYSIEELRKDVALLGWRCSEVQVLLGTKQLVDENRIGISNSPSLDHGFQLDAVNIGANVGVNIKGFTLQFTGTAIFKRVDRFISYTTTTNFANLLDRGCIESAILYDTTAKRAWLVPKLSVLLHMAHVYVKYYDTKADLPYAEACWDGGEAAVAAISNQGGRRMSCRGDVANQELLQTYLTDVWAYHMAAKQILDKTKARRGKIFGFDFMDMAIKRSPSHLREVDISGDSSGNWHYLCRTKFCWVIFCRDLGGAIQPVMTADCRCKKTSLVEQHDYLGTTTKCLQKLAEIAGGDREELKTIVDDGGRKVVSLHSPAEYFQDLHGLDKPCCCIRPQKLEKHNQNWTRNENERVAGVNEHGGVVIGS